MDKPNNKTAKKEIKLQKSKKLEALENLSARELAGALRSVLLQEEEKKGRRK